MADDLEVMLPSVQLDLAREDIGDATQGTDISTLVEAFALADGQTLLVAVDGGAAQSVAFLSVDFDDIAATTAAEAVNVINGALVGAVASDELGAVRLTSDVFGAASSIQVTGGTAAAAFGFSGALKSGSDVTPITQLINRIPEPNEQGVPVSTSLEIEIHSGNGTAPNAATVLVWVDGVLAWDGAVYDPAFSGVVANPDVATLRFRFGPVSGLDSDVSVLVRVTESVSGLDESYSFTTEDLTAPIVTDVVARTRSVVRVTFSEPVLQVSPSSAADALNPSNYLFTRVAVPAVDVVPMEVLPIDSVTVDIYTDLELSFGLPYALTVSNVEDLFGNAVSGGAFVFDSFQPEIPDGRHAQLIEWLPQLNRTEDTTGELALFVAILQDVFDLLLYSVDDWTRILDPDFAPEDFLDAMLLDLGNPFAFAALDETDKRRLLRVLVSIYKAKGTAQGIIDVIRFFVGPTVTIDVFNGGGWELAAADGPTLDGTSPPAGPGDELSSATEEPADAASLGPDESRLLYSFVVVSPVNLTDEERARILSIVDFMKPAHTHLVDISEPAAAAASVDHLELGVSELGGGTVGTWTLH